MYQRRRARILLAALVLLALVLITIDFRSEGEGPLDQARSLATSLFAPVQEGLSAVMEPVATALGSVGDVFRLSAENERLRRQLEQAREQRRSLTDLQRENERLRGLLGAVEERDLDVIVARTIALGPSNYEWTATLDRGTADGVERDMVVIDADGLVGRIIQVGPSSSRVLLAIDHNFAAAAHVARLGEQGRISGRGGDLMRFLPLDPETPVEQGDEIVTSRYDNGLFPAGIPIGNVEQVGEQTALLTREVQVRPFVDFTRLGAVLVIRRLPPPELPPVSEETLGGVPPTAPSAPSPGGQPAPSPGAPSPGGQSAPSPGGQPAPSPGGQSAPSPGGQPASSPQPVSSP